MGMALYIAPGGQLPLIEWRQDMPAFHVAFREGELLEVYHVG